MRAHRTGIGVAPDSRGDPLGDSEGELTGRKAVDNTAVHETAHVALPVSDALFPRLALLVDLYELTMGESYVAEGIAERPATFQLSCRHLPAGWGYFVAAGPRRRARLPRAAPVHSRRPRVPGDGRALQRLVPRSARPCPLHGRGAGDARGDGLLPGRAAARGDGAAARGAARRDVRPQRAPLPFAAPTAAKPA
jgi:hypothetical protein